MSNGSSFFRRKIKVTIGNINYYMENVKAIRKRVKKKNMLDTQNMRV